jgi:hypothetical protein
MYRMVCAPHCHPPQQQHHQLVICPPPHQGIVPRAVAPPQIMPHPPSQKMGIVANTVSNTCYNCSQVGHIVRDWTAARWNSAPHPRSHCNQPPRDPTKVIANYTTVEDVPEGEQVLAGIFFLNGRPIVILFDSGASHDFITKVYTQKC